VELDLASLAFPVRLFKREDFPQLLLPAKAIYGS